MSNTFYLQPNQQVNGVYTGTTYVFDSSGGFSVDQSFPQVNLNTYSPIAQYDVTEALQITYSVRTLNNKIGVIKDQSNVNVVEVLYYDVINNVLINDTGATTDSVTINSSEFTSGITTSNVISMGKMSTLYSDFNYTVMEYFGAPYGFSTVFSNASTFNANKGVFDASAFVNLINGITFDGVTGSVISDLSGYFTVNNLNQHLRFICGTNVFGNRPPSGNYGVPNGFMAGDLIYIPNGIKITLSVNIEAEPYSPPNNVGPTNLSSPSINNKINWSDPQYNIHKNTTSTLENITQTYSVPILIILENEDKFNSGNYGYTWIDVGTSNNVGNLNWLSISISSLGQYQSAIDDQGDIYRSQDYGATWSQIYNIGPSITASIGISETGRYQTVSNGFGIYVSSNYGVNWTNKYFLGSSDIFVSVSLCGQYQSIISSGDSLYTSNDYGNTWNRYGDTESDLYNSIESFPTGAISISFTGQYQSIACENIYLSQDYGQTWQNAFVGQDFDDHNWDGIAISSTGKMQTAVDSGGDIYHSQDYGVTWSPITSINVLYKNWQAVAMSADAQFQTVLEVGGGIYVSNDGGNTWNISPDTTVHNKNWQSVAVSANGQYQTAVINGGSIYTSNLL